MKIITAASGDEVLVDDADYDDLRRMPWYIQKHGLTSYAKTVIEGRQVYMHRLIMEEPEGMVVDHLDRNGLNNQRSNLEVVTSRENLRRSVRLDARLTYDAWKQADDWKPSE